MPGVHTFSPCAAYHHEMSNRPKFTSPRTVTDLYGFLLALRLLVLSSGITGLGPRIVSYSLCRSVLGPLRGAQV